MPHAGAKAAKATKTVTITTNPLSVDKPSVTISKKNKENVVWQTRPPGKDFVVAFEGTSPFSRQTFDQDHNDSGVPVLTPDPGVSLAFKYWVQVGDQVLDPGVIIQQ